MRAAILCIGSVLAAGCAQPDAIPSPSEPDRLYGKVTKNGQPTKGYIVVAIGANGETKSSSATDADGEYRLDNPPRGMLKFQIMAAPPKPIPLKYLTAKKSELSCEYTGGRKQYDIDMK